MNSLRYGLIGFYMEDYSPWLSDSFNISISVSFASLFSILISIFQTPCADNKDFAILRCHAGPPYEDIAFKIVNREWEYSYKRGFRCQFQNNIFQLWFHFKRYRYRR